MVSPSYSTTPSPHPPFAPGLSCHTGAAHGSKRQVYRLIASFQLGQLKAYGLAHYEASPPQVGQMWSSTFCLLWGVNGYVELQPILLVIRQMFANNAT